MTSAGIGPARVPVSCWPSPRAPEPLLGTEQKSAIRPTFERDVRPILRTHCLDCHGSQNVRKGGLDLRLRRLMVKGGESGPAISPGHPDRQLSARSRQIG